MLWGPISRLSLREKKEQEGPPCGARHWLSCPAPLGQEEVCTLGSVSSHLYSSTCWLWGSPFQLTGIPQAHLYASFSHVCVHTGAHTPEDTWICTFMCRSPPFGASDIPKEYLLASFRSQTSEKSVGPLIKNPHGSRHLGGSMVEHLPWVQFMILGSLIKSLHRSLCREPAYPSAYVSASLSVSLSINKLNLKKKIKPWDVSKQSWEENQGLSLGAEIEEMRRNQQKRQKRPPVSWEENQESILSLKPREGKNVSRRRYY